MKLNLVCKTHLKLKTLMFEELTVGFIVVRELQGDQNRWECDEVIHGAYQVSSTGIDYSMVR